MMRRNEILIRVLLRKTSRFHLTKQNPFKKDPKPGPRKTKFGSNRLGRAMHDPGKSKAQACTGMRPTLACRPHAFHVVHDGPRVKVHAGAGAGAGACMVCRD